MPSTPHSAAAGRSSVDAAEVARFSAQAAAWWDERGSMRMLHRLNPLRLGYIRDQAVTRFARDGKRIDALAGLRALDIGCGGGILSEPLARMGASVVGIDPAPENVEAARRHAEAAALAIDYRSTTAEALADAGERFDIVLAMEVVEHVADVPLFVRRAAEMVKPGGLMVAATINRTFKSFGLAIVAAEYVLGWVPRGTHRWDRLVTPEELDAAMTAGGLAPSHSTGVVYNPFADAWQLSADMDVNYMMAAVRD
ncbi:MAG: bifunctional 2-polyprenyl-6-hydroxyphenol methylase/3-demethylubiquinol 3-O-methyltransferase UbiG [Variibacter sp.]|nr:bifunctional 2-polyprenyl-6-hydroxyphenol methylase/3-demethylubiquinol 3-O-methyltransferase UbiG [Variibacter sp.]